MFWYELDKEVTIFKLFKPTYILEEQFMLRRKNFCNDINVSLENYSIPLHRMTLFQQERQKIQRGSLQYSIIFRNFKR